MNDTFQKTQLFLKVLMNGFVAVVGGREYRMTEDYEPVIVMSRYINGVEQEEDPFYGKTDMSVSELCKLCENMTAEEQFDLAATMTLNPIV